MLSLNLNAVNWNTIQGPVDLEVHVPREMTGIAESVEGTLHVSRTGYVYSLASPTVLRMKFLGLTALLKVTVVAETVKQAVRQVFQRPPFNSEIKRLTHLKHLSNIANAAIFDDWNDSLAYRVEQFALAEIDYNNPHREEELNRARSTRLKTGAYVAKCMQPLFHTSRAQRAGEASLVLKMEIDGLKSELYALQSELEKRQIPPSTYTNIFSIFTTKLSIANMSDDDICLRMEDIKDQLKDKEHLLRLAERCQRYAATAILKQQGCLIRAMKDAAVEPYEVECCNVMCYKHQKICGLLYKIDCCATSCFALDCLCCMLCFWPAGRQACMI